MRKEEEQKGGFTRDTGRNWKRKGGSEEEKINKEGLRGGEDLEELQEKEGMRCHIGSHLRRKLWPELASRLLFSRVLRSLTAISPCPSWYCTHSCLVFKLVNNTFWWGWDCDIKSRILCM